MKRIICLLLSIAVCLPLFVTSALADTGASTRIHETTSAYRNNVDLALAMLDGVDVWNYDMFSFNETVGPRTAAEGYQRAVNGRGVTVVGGGVAQVATTLYLALQKRGDIDYVDKYTYGSNFTGGYVSSGSSAIVTDDKNGQDFSFLNEGDPFTISAYRSGNTIYVDLIDSDSWTDDMDDDYDDSDWSSSGWDDDEIFPNSSYRKLSRADILEIPMSLWAYARNEIYARHGYRFNTKKYADYFAEKSWYTPGGFSTTDLNATEWYNMDLIKEMEKSYGATPAPSGSTSGSGGYIFPHSSARKLTRSEILDIPKSQWGYARNEIYARHGYAFQTKKYADYFAGKSWYRKGGFSTTDLNATEWYNMELIKSMEDEYGVS